MSLFKQLVFPSPDKLCVLPSSSNTAGHRVPGLCRSPGGCLGQAVPAAPPVARGRREFVEVEGAARDCPDLGWLDAGRTQRMRCN